MKLKLYKYGKISDKDLQKECKEIFIKEYIKDKQGNKKAIKTKDDKRVFFHESIFKHAFSRKRGGLEEFDYSRARRVFWIRAVIKEQVENMSVLVKEITKKKKRSKPKYQRLYYVPKKEYLVVLQWNSSKKKFLKFITHYKVTMKWKRQQLKRLFDI